MQQRLKLSTPSQERLASLLFSYGVDLAPTGQEYWLPTGFHNKLRHIHISVTIDLVRYFPDFIAFVNSVGWFLLEAKATTPDYYDGPNFSIETACLTLNTKLVGLGAQVLILFENRPNEFLGDWAENIKPIYSTNQTRDFKGSKTPMTLVAKSSLLRLNTLLLSNQIKV